MVVHRDRTPEIEDDGTLGDRKEIERRDVRALSEGG